MTNPEFSIVIPFHNAGETIGATLKSILAQSVENVEVIIVDDRSGEIDRFCIDAMARMEPRVRVVASPRPGPSAARNTGASHAGGDILYFLDADDTLEPGALESIRKAFGGSPRAGVVFGRVRITDAPEKKGGVVSRYVRRPEVWNLIGENVVCTGSNIAVRRAAFNAIGDFEERLRRAEDQEWLVRAWANRDWELRSLDRVTLAYRTSPDGLSSNLEKMEIGWLQMIAVLRGSGMELRPADMARAKGLFYRYLARRALRLSDGKAHCIRYALVSLRACPSLFVRDPIRSWGALLGAVAVRLWSFNPLKSQSIQGANS